MLLQPISTSSAGNAVQQCLQQVSWAESTWDADLARRNLSLPLHYQVIRPACCCPSSLALSLKVQSRPEAEKLCNPQGEPLFCMETAVKLLAFSQAIYLDGTPFAAESDLHVKEADSMDAAQTCGVDEVRAFTASSTLSLDCCRRAEASSMTRVMHATLSMT
jgi:hypothetical protein